ncbi:hypothetical protein VSO92_05430 [Myroides pelagicus]|uniref:hypothetical protein n=1 Tax=Myroides pelagicus TaxID=270914 RepID=UPI002DBF1DF8|nr:hypothetical protein [Myroides pelagicus]MEC4113548.1 hypothetical protein [Myroides pelagicus]
MKLTAEHFVPSEYDEQTLERIIEINELPVILSIFNADDNLEEILVDVNQTMEHITELNKKGIQLISDKLFKSYSKKYSISREEFAEDFNLVSLYFTGDGEVEFTYEGNEDIFGEQIVCISLVNGRFEKDIAVEG